VRYPCSSDLASVAIEYHDIVMLVGPINPGEPHALAPHIPPERHRIPLPSTFGQGCPRGWFAAFEAVTGMMIEGVFVAMLAQRTFCA
jgi:hypothetical protein